MTPTKRGKTRQTPVFDLNSVTGLLRRQLTGAMAATNVPISLSTLADLLVEIDRLRSMLDAEAGRIVPIKPKPDESSPDNYRFEAGEDRE